jgi:hypothetical protein
MYQQIILDKSPDGVLNVSTLNKETDMERNEYHEGKPSLLTTNGRVIVLCPKGHVVEAMLVAEWARSWSEVRASATVRCCGT